MEISGGYRVVREGYRGLFGVGGNRGLERELLVGLSFVQFSLCGWRRYLLVLEHDGRIGFIGAFVVECVERGKNMEV